MGYRDLAYHQLRELRISIERGRWDEAWELAGDLVPTLTATGEQDELAGLMLDAVWRKDRALLQRLLQPLHETIVPVRDIFLETAGWRIQRDTTSGIEVRRGSSGFVLEYANPPQKLAPGFFFAVQNVPGSVDEARELVRAGVAGHYAHESQTLSGLVDLYAAWKWRKRLEGLARWVAAQQSSSAFHYHVLVGLHGGYMPNVNDVYATREEALEGAGWYVEQENEQRAEGAAIEGDPNNYEEVVLSPDGYADFGIEFVEVVECNEQDCEIDDD